MIHYMVQAFSTNGADQPFHLWALPGRPRSREHFDDIHVRCLCPKGVAVDPIAVPEQAPRRPVPGEHLHELRLCVAITRRGRRSSSVTE